MRQRPTIVLATRNPSKLREIRDMLGGAPFDLVATGDGIAEPVETGLTFAANACQKALYYAGATGRWCLADDSGLEVDALEGRPGVTSARFASDHCPPGAQRETIDRANNARLLEELKDTPDAMRTARFVCHLALADTRGVLAQTFGVIEGRIGRKERGENGFGYDPLFLLPQMGLTTAQLSAADKNVISHRGQAVRHVAGILRNLLTAEPG